MTSPQGHGWVVMGKTIWGCALVGGKIQNGSRGEGHWQIKVVQDW